MNWHFVGLFGGLVFSLAVWVALIVAVAAVT